MRILGEITLAAMMWACAVTMAVSSEKSEFERRYGETLKKGDAAFAEFIHEHAERSDQAARCLLGQFYATGVGASVAQDYDKAARYLLGLDYHACSMASILLAVMYRDGLGVEKDEAKAKVWFRRATFLLESNGIEDLPLPKGADVTADVAEAKAWHSRLFKNSDPQTQYREGLKYLSGDGVPADPVVAHELLEIAAIDGIAEARYHLGKAYLEGVFPTDNPRHGVLWLYYAAKAGVVPAQKELVIWYAEHARSEMDDVKAYYWLRRATSSGVEFSHLAETITRRTLDTDKSVVDAMLERGTFPSP